MQDNSFAEITVTQITQEAMVARRTFYLNYQNKEEVIREYIKALFDEFSEERNIAQMRDFNHDTVAFFRFWQQHSDFLLLLRRNHILNLMLEEYEQILAETTLFYIGNVTRNEVSKTQTKYVRTVLAASLMAMLLEWIRNDLQESPEELADVMANMMYYHKH